MNFMKNFLREEDGMAAVEYALVAALMAAIIVASVTLLGPSFTAAFTAIAGHLTTGT